MIYEIQPNPWMALPFAILLALLALAPMFFRAWWERHYVKVTLALAVITLSYYLARLGAVRRVGETVMDYLGFIALIGSLFVVSGGIHIQVRRGTSPVINTLFLFTGALLANLLGTTGASMLLIRPWLRLNESRARAYHVVFFIFIVSNSGGCLTPLADPPLFLGYLAGVPFLWTVRHCFAPWAAGLALLLGMFLAVDWFRAWRGPKVNSRNDSHPDNWRLEGWPNLFFLAVIVGSVFITRPPLLRESLMLLAAIGSYFTTPKRIHAANQFSFEPLKEVAILFLGIFATMMPAMDWLAENAGNGAGNHPSPALFYWSTGALSSVLDNAPTYLGFLHVFFGSFVSHDLLGQLEQLIQTGGAGLNAIAGPHAGEIRQAYAWFRQHHPGNLSSAPVGMQELEMCFLLGNAKFKIYLLAISVGSVFFGAATYIGNGPNLLIKAIAERQRVETPSFPGYIAKFTLPFLLPTLVLLWLWFFRS